jgi:hypothetical protein
VTNPSPEPAHELIVEFVGEEQVLAPGQELTFGRAGDLEIDDNRYLHRVVGRFHHVNGMWWLLNEGSSIALRLADTNGPSYSKVAPGARVPLAFESARLTFEAGGRNYELGVELVVEHEIPDVDDETPLESAEVTTTAAALPLNEEQRLLLVALAAPMLREPGATHELPTNRQVATQLGWTITKFNRKLDGLCKKYASAGVSGLRGSTDLLARDRRVRLVEHVVTAGVITEADLDLLA